MAERVGFEPTVRFPARSLSRRVLSTAQPPLRGRCRFNRSRALRFSAIKPSICAEKAAGFAKDNHSRVGRRRIIANCAVARSSENLAVMNEHRADRNFAACGCGARFTQGLLHELDVNFHCRRENNTLKQGEKKERRRCLTIGEGGNKLSACANSWGDCFKSIS